MIGRTISHYEVLERIGQGGMGIVYKCRDQVLGRFVALKVLPPDALSNPERRQRLIHEARTASALNHFNIVTIYEVAQVDGVDFIAMEFIEGTALNVILEGGPLSVERAIRYGSQVALALAAAHQAGIVHRDIKPGNILITTDDRAKVLDFGLAKLTEPPSASHAEAGTLTATATQPGTVLGTIAYMSPEQAEGKPLDPRSDIFSLGVVLFEMLAGRRPFAGDSPISTLLAILRDPAPDLGALRAHLPPPLNGIVRRALEKKPADRYQSAAELASDLNAAPRTAEARKRRMVIAAAVLAVAAIAGWSLYRQSRIRWARNNALVEARRLVDQAKLTPAYDLAAQAEKIVPDDPDLKLLWHDVARDVNLDSEPSGAKVWRKDFTEPDAAFRYMGVTPLKNFRTVRGYHHLKFEKEGYATTNEVAMANAVEMRYRLAPKVDVPEGMALIPPAPQLTQSVAGLAMLVLTGVDYFFIDRYEVTNRRFKAFVDAGGYSKPEYWKEAFVDGSKTLAFDQAIDRFLDSTGRTGPASWIGGSFPEGREDYPVSGVSWFEAAAYARFAGKDLPTIYHWFRVADPRISVINGPLSNIGGKQLAQVGQFPNSAPFGTWDMIGNVKEWVYNEAGNGLRFIEGGAANELAYQANAADARSPWDRALSNGFRCVRYPKPLAAAYLSPKIRETRDYSKEKPASDETFTAFKRFYTCEGGELKPSVDSVDDSNEEWRREKVSFQTCYGDERVFGYLFLPKDAHPPFQAVVYSPCSDAQTIPSSERLSGFGRVDFIIRSGRAVFWPVVKGQYERRYLQPLTSAAELRDARVKPILDMFRSVDYLQTRPDVSPNRIAYAGTSAGATLGILVTALEPRFQAAVLMDAGLPIRRYSPEFDMLNFAPRVKVPVLMFNGRYDFTFPVQESQNPLFQLLGTAEADKRHVLFDAAHDSLLFRTDLVREVLAWLDKYLGTAKK